MPEYTPRWALPFLEEGQDGSEVTHNEALILIDAIMGAKVKDRDLTTPPGSPSQGDTYIVATGGTGSWDDKDGKLAVYVSGWKFASVPVGAVLYVEDEDELIVQKTGGWETVTTT
jgi:hypothetical protein